MSPIKQYLVNSQLDSPRLAELRNFLNLPPNWDSYNASPISENCISEASEVVRSFNQQGMPIDFVVPLRDGGVQLEISTALYDLEIEIHPEAESTPTAENIYLIFNKSCDLIDEGKFDLKTIHTIIKKLSA